MNDVNIVLCNTSKACVNSRNVQDALFARAFVANGGVLKQDFMMLCQSVRENMREEQGKLSNTMLSALRKD